MVLFIPELLFRYTTIFDQLEIPSNNNNSIFQIDIRENWKQCNIPCLFSLIIHYLNIF